MSVRGTLEATPYGFEFGFGQVRLVRVQGIGTSEGAVVLPAVAGNGAGSFDMAQVKATESPAAQRPADEVPAL